MLNLDRPNWTRDELILACALAESHGWRQVYDTEAGAKELSQLLQSTAIHPLPRHPDFRNPAGVGQKTRNIVDHHPGHRGPRSNGNRLDKEVLDDYLADPPGMRAMADRIRELLTSADADGSDLSPLDFIDLPAGEGGVALRAHLRRERDPKLPPRHQHRRLLGPHRRRAVGQRSPAPRLLLRPRMTRKNAMQLPPETVEELTHRLRKIGGQLRGIEAMLTDQRDCRQVATQVSAANKALEQVGFLLIAAGFRWCIEHPAEAAADGYSLDDVQNLFLKLA